MSKFYGYFYPELSHWFGVTAVQRLEKKIGCCALQALESMLFSSLVNVEQKEMAINELFDVHESSIR